MFMSISICTFFVITCGSLAAKPQHSKDEEQSYIRMHIREYFGGRQREKRSVSSVIAAIFKNARLVFKDKYYKVYEKPGGYNQAFDDFDLLSPNNLERTEQSVWGNIGDTIVMLTETSGEFFMTLWKPVRNTEGKKYASIFRIRYKD